MISMAPTVTLTAHSSSTILLLYCEMIKQKVVNAAEASKITLRWKTYFSIISIFKNNHYIR